MDYEKAYRDMREVFDDPCIQKALKFAAENPITVYGDNSIECQRVNHGFFDLYFSINRSTAEDEGA